MNALTFVVLGGSGDLARRLLLPGLAQCMAEDPSLDVTLVGAGLSDEEDYAGSVRKALQAAGAPDESMERLVAKTSWMSVDATSPQDLERLLGGRTDPGPIERSSTSRCRRPSRS